MGSKNPRHGPRSDPQRDLVYTMESRHFGARFVHRARIRDLRKLLAKLCRQAKLPVIPLKVYEMKGGFIGCYYPSTNSIALHSRTGAHYMMLCHEFAHYYTHVYFPRATDHGATWMGVYALALEAAKVMPRVAFEASARLYGIKYKRLG